MARDEEGFVVWLVGALMGFIIGGFVFSSCLIKCSQDTCKAACVREGHDGGYQKGPVCACVEKTFTPYRSSRKKAR